MNSQYRICIIVPQGYKHSYVFLETAVLIKNSLEDLGLSSEIVLNDLSRDKTNIILGYHLLTYSDSLNKYRYIPYQLEQLIAGGGVFTENLKRVLNGAEDIWDYSAENIVLLREHGISARHLPVGYHEKMEQIRHGERNIDVIFYGSVNPRRKRVLDELSAAGLSVKALFGVYKQERDGFISRSRIVLNIHHYSTKIFEAVRISYLLNNRCFIVSEESSVYPYDGVEMCLVPYDNIVDTCRRYLQNQDRMEEEAFAAYSSFKRHYHMRDLLESVLKT